MKSKILLAGLVVVMALTYCTAYSQATGTPDAASEFKVTILYPNGEGKTFDMDYYSEKHMPMVAELLGDSMKGFAIDKVIMGRTPDEDIPYLAIGYLFFESVADYQNSFGPNADKIVADIPNYTNIQPVVVITEVVKK